jgi:hypothetical protein
VNVKVDDVIRQMVKEEVARQLRTDHAVFEKPTKKAVVQKASKPNAALRTGDTVRFKKRGGAGRPFTGVFVKLEGGKAIVKDKKGVNLTLPASKVWAA